MSRHETNRNCHIIHMSRGVSIDCNTVPCKRCFLYSSRILACSCNFIVCSYEIDTA